MTESAVTAAKREPSELKAIAFTAAPASLTCQEHEGAWRGKDEADSRRSAATRTARFGGSLDEGGDSSMRRRSKSSSRPELCAVAKQASRCGLHLREVTAELSLPSLDEANAGRGTSRLWSGRHNKSSPLAKPMRASSSGDP
eukprot:CAMPEP_0119348006 /NCGR_PEP_ID=MMETSP1333-20130426/108818_1 /TAXON_ID=418940 /ORGANISM="Scyphosphaera apsteinii, Strain RCC1455" /LENGTH=141 /DNA_ID=CAMNT_0007360569 /DNA_START=749 /DNA_END=1171 /DNA_ORIENTATION=+